MSSELGERIKTTIFGQSHGEAIGVCIDGLPAGEKIDFKALDYFLQRRRPGKTPLSTERCESDRPHFLSGIGEDGVLNGAPLCAVIQNTNVRSGDYHGFEDTPRPGHADYTATVKYHGSADLRGGGHFSGRLTAPLCIAGGIAKQLLLKKGIAVGAHLFTIGGLGDTPFPLFPEEALFEAIAAKPFPVIDDAKGDAMQNMILRAKEEKDSVGGIIECAIIGLAPGFGGPLFGGLEGRLGTAIFGIPGVNGLEFGDGFGITAHCGSVVNDAFCFDHEGRVVTKTNHCGGILGGISNGMPLLFRAAIKPTPSIGKPQNTVNLKTKESAEITIEGRHDPCIAPRAVPVVEAAAALTILDLITMERKNNL